MNQLSRYIVLLFLLLFVTRFALAQEGLKKPVGEALTIIANKEMRVGKVTVKTILINDSKKTIEIATDWKFGGLNFREENVTHIYDTLKTIFPPIYSNYKIRCKVDHHYIEDLIPNYYRTEKKDKERRFMVNHKGAPLVTRVSRPNEVTKGLQERHIAMWQSHGLFFDQENNRWRWQRSRLFQTVEDLYTQSYVLPYIVPMLENAGAIVLLPRERDVRSEEIVVDNNDVDSPSAYLEWNGKYTWGWGAGYGFGNISTFYLDGENPFRSGTYRQIPVTDDEENICVAEWIPDIEKTGKYAVYVSYVTTDNSISDAHYSVYHLGGKTEFLVNQTMYGGTWLYLGHFDFEQENTANGKVVLSNLSRQKGRIVTADAVKFGGGMGNIARQPYMQDSLYIDSLLTVRKGKVDLKKETIPYVTAPGYLPEISTYPRFTEGARYWLQWAGMPDSIYMSSKGQSDYIDDLRSRALWVNYISGGSPVAPKRQGLKVPVDMVFAMHSDAGFTYTDSIIGTLGICTTVNDKKKEYENGVSRLASRDMIDLVMTQVINDVRELYEPKWTRRLIYDKSYYEARVPEIPSIILECLSHQNFADMRYGLDPRFQFDFSRAIYKGILKFYEANYGKKYIVQPLPVEQMSISFIDNYEVELRWNPVNDPLEPTAKATRYIVYTRVNGGGFDNGVLVDNNSFRMSIFPDDIYSFKVTAVNEGGESFPSEILSVCRSSENKGEVLIVNAFDRISAPGSFRQDSICSGFDFLDDAGVPYIQDIAFVGKQYELNCMIPWVSDDDPGFGASHADYETMVIAGNTFDYPYVHGKAIRAAGYSFVSCSKKAVTNGDVRLEDYKIADVILGKQKETFIGNREKMPEFKTFPLDLQRRIDTYCLNGGKLIVSGAYIGSDLHDRNNVNSPDKTFLEEVLKIKYSTSLTADKGGLNTSTSGGIFDKSIFSYYNEPNSDYYFAESVDVIEPVDNNGFTICRYKENNQSAGIVYNNGENKICAFGFPFEIIKQESERNKLMNGILQFFNNEMK